MSKELIYCVEDDEHIVQLLKYNLECAGYKVQTFESGELLLLECHNSFPDMFILDIMLPGIDGIEVCKRLKNNLKAKNIPIVILSAKSEEFDKVFGLEIGADDYITKPFSVRELLARIKALFRRISIPVSEDNSSILRYENFTIDVSRHNVFNRDNTIELSIKEFDLLKLFFQNIGKVLTREMLLDKVWGYDFIGETRTVDVHIHYLRQKIEEDESTPKYIETVRGVGYRLKDFNT